MKTKAIECLIKYIFNKVIVKIEYMKQFFFYCVNSEKVKSNLWFTYKILIIIGSPDNVKLKAHSKFSFCYIFIFYYIKYEYFGIDY